MKKYLIALPLLAFLGFFAHCPDSAKKADQGMEETKITPENAEQEADQLLKDIEEL
ncbi:MAG: hypothetical protein KDK25_04235 [Leptospiraceae bacterium]|nr:hypothetical protein [Leptospiraceae bacterium]